MHEKAEKEEETAFDADHGAMEPQTVKPSLSAGLQSAELLQFTGVATGDAGAMDPAAAQAAALDQANRHAVQMKGGGEGSGVHQAAQTGVQGPGQALPHLSTIQRAFGGHDVTGVKAHVGGAATSATDALGAEAYATGNDVAFKSAPDLHTAAHEAAHVVQQRGGVSLKGGVGESGDTHERHADAVADAVVQGRSAEGLLDRYAGARTEGLQNKIQFAGADGVKAVSATAMKRLKYAQEAIDYTKGILSFGAGNQIKDLSRTKFNSNMRLKVARYTRYWRVSPDAQRIANTNGSAYRAARAEIAQGGNCGEHAHLAYNYLRYKAPGELISRGSVKGFDHAFAFVGPAGPGANMADTAVSDPWPTGPKAVLWEDHFAKSAMKTPADINVPDQMVADGGNPKELIKAGLTLTDEGKQLLTREYTEEETKEAIDDHEAKRDEQGELGEKLETLASQYRRVKAEIDGGKLTGDAKTAKEYELMQIKAEYDSTYGQYKQIKLWMWGQEDAHEQGHDHDYKLE